MNQADDHSVGEKEGALWRIANSVSGLVRAKPEYSDCTHVLPLKAFVNLRKNIKYELYTAIIH